MNFLFKTNTSLLIEFDGLDRSRDFSKHTVLQNYALYSSAMSNVFAYGGITVIMTYYETWYDDIHLATYKGRWE